jgi:AcrR family transcriptional regulator
MEFLQALVGYVKIHATVMTVEKRPYEKKRRAELEAETRRRITETAVDLHGTVGPSRTSISAIAERAGVRRSTVYRHFPDEAALFGACSAHWEAANPPPDLAGWEAVRDPDERLRAALGELYAFYGRTERMMENLHRDELTMPTVKRLFAGFHQYLAAGRDILLRGRPERGRRRAEARAAIGHALAFTTWRSLTREQGLDDAQAAELMCRLVAG